jgi:hypothetical protein
MVKNVLVQQISSFFLIILVTIIVVSGFALKVTLGTSI